MWKYNISLVCTVTDVEHAAAVPSLRWKFADSTEITNNYYSVELR
jgi:hypothetical protein